MRTFSCCVVAGFVLLSPTAKGADPAKLPPATKRVIDYQRAFKPILAKACLSCHGPEKQRAGLRLDSRQKALEGGDSGTILKPGDSAGSRLIHIVAGLDADVSMPPKGKPPLTGEEIGHLRAWIDQGMQWPAEGGDIRVAQSTHWAFRTPRRLPLPGVRGQGSGVRN